MAFIIVISVFNGFDSVVKSLFSSFDPDIKISAVEGKTFNPNSINFESVKTLQGVKNWAYVLEENAILKYDTRQQIATVKGVSNNYNSISSIDSLIISGNSKIQNDGYDFALVGLGIASKLGLRITFVDPIRIYTAKKGKQISTNLSKTLNQNYIFPTGIFSTQEEIDAKYIIVPLEYARNLFEEPENISAIELKIDKLADVEDIKKSIKSILGESFHVKNKYEQHELIFRTMNFEKFATFLILVFILAIASFNIIGSISMLILDKKEDIIVLRSFGASKKLIERIFMLEGWLISVLGAVSGLVLGLLVCWLQINFQIIKFPGNGSFAVSAYPVVVRFTDVVLVFISVLSIGLILSRYPVKYISAKSSSEE